MTYDGKLKSTNLFPNIVEKLIIVQKYINIKIETLPRCPMFYLYHHASKQIGYDYEFKKIHELNTIINQF